MHTADRPRSPSRRGRDGAPRVNVVLVVVAVVTGLGLLIGVGAHLVAAPEHRAAAGPAPTISSPVPAFVPTAGAPGRPLQLSGDAADPRVIDAGGRHYLFTTNRGLLNVPVRSASSVLGPWSQTTDALPKLPTWARFGKTWHPEVHEFGSTWVLYFSAQAQPSGLECMGIAVASDVTGPYTPTNDTTPWLCQRDRWGSLDARVTVASDGTPWLVWKDDSFAQRQPTTIYSQALSSDGRTLVGTRHTLLSATAAGWSTSNLESPDLVADPAGHWWLFLSMGPFAEPSYAMAVVGCAGPAGPCNALGGPLVASNAQGAGPGEQSLYRDSGGRCWLLYNPSNVGEWGDGPTPDRGAVMALVDFSSGKPQISVDPRPPS